MLLMADKPKLTASSPEIQAQLGKLRDAVATLADGLPARGREAAQEASPRPTNWPRASSTP